jgi:UDP-glucose 4-epimerase
MVNALVIGGGGFIGSHLCRELVGQGWRVTVIDRDPSEEFLRLSSPLLTCVKVDLHNDRDLASRVQESSVIFHLAAQPSVVVCEKDPAQSTRDNLLTTVKIVEELKRTDKQQRMLLFTSTSAVYGRADGESPLSEASPCNPLSHYGKDKLRSEHVIRDAAGTTGAFRYCLFRLFNVYGPGQKDTSPYSGVITRFMHSFCTSAPLEIHGSGKQVRDFVHVKDVARALALGGRSSGFEQPLNVATGRGTTINQLADWFAGRKQLTVRRVEKRQNDVFFSIGDPTRIQSTLNWSASIVIDEGLEQLVNAAERGVPEMFSSGQSLHSVPKKGQ